jgi:hypothetical protein
MISHHTLKEIINKEFSLTDGRNEISESELNLSQQSSGIYLLHVRMNELLQVIKIVKN